MTAHADVTTIAAAAKSADLAAMETQFAECQASLRIVHRNLDVEREAASAAFSSAHKIKNQTTMDAAAAKVVTLTAMAAALEKTSTELRRKIEAARPASAAAVKAALSPLRQQAANDIALTAAALYRAIAAFNLTSTALEANGVPSRVMPATIPVLDHILDQVSKGPNADG